MTKIIEYFSANRYKPKYYLGDRVRGFWNSIPFAGTVDIDTAIHENQEPYVIVTLDLPIKFDNKYHTMIKIKHTDIIEGSYESNRKTNSKKSMVGSNRRKR